MNVTKIIPVDNSCSESGINKESNPMLKSQAPIDYSYIQKSLKSDGNGPPPTASVLAGAHGSDTRREYKGKQERDTGNQDIKN